MPTTGAVFSTGLDYITATFQRDDVGIAVFDALTAKHFAACAKQGLVVEEISPNGYQGHSCDGVFWGTGKYGGMLRVSGARAERWKKDLLGYGCRPHLTRLDLQVSWFREPGDASFAQRYRTAIRRTELERGAKRFHKLGFVEKVVSGDSLSIGSRESEHYFRFYDKSDESKGLVPENLLRAESECKGGLAVAVWQQVKEGADSTQLAAGFVRDRVQRMGITPEWDDDVDAVRVQPVCHKSDDVKRLMYLRDSIRPMVAKLVEAGHEQQVREVLGLPLYQFGDVGQEQILRALMNETDRGHN